MDTSIARRITLTAGSLRCGGAERVLTWLAQAWVAAGRDVTVITLSSRASDFFELGPHIERVALDLISDSKSRVQGGVANLRRARAIRRAIRASRPDVVVSFIDTMNVLVLAATAGLRVPVVVSERIDPTQYAVGGAWSLLRRLSYARAAAVVVQSEVVRSWALGFLPPARVHVIGNPVREMKAADSCKPRAPIVLGIGRLDRQKGFDLLMEAFASCAGDAKEWRLRILGEGPERGALEGQATALGISARVQMPGQVRDIEAELGRAGIFVLSSRFEGFPNVLVEAMSAGIPCVAFDCPSGPGEIVRSGEDGLLVRREDIGSLASAMARLIGDETERGRLGIAAARIRERFGAPRILAAWSAVVDGASRSQSRATSSNTASQSSSTLPRA